MDTLRECFPLLAVIHINVDPGSIFGGSDEPQGLAAVVWAIATFLPLTVLFILVLIEDGKLPREPLREAFIVTVAILLSLGVASLVFYGPVFGFPGFREYLKGEHFDYVNLEIALVIIWSAILSAFPFFSIYALKTLKLISVPGASLKTCMFAIFFTVLLTYICVGFFISTIPLATHESARGMVAGLFLKIWFFFGLIISSVATDEIVRCNLRKMYDLYKKLLDYFGKLTTL